MKKPLPKDKLPRRSKPRKSDTAELNQATSADFEREGMGVAPKE